MRESENKNKRRLFLKFQLNPILHFQVTHDYVCYIAPKDNCLVDETFCEYCSHFILKWFQPNSFGEMSFLELSRRKCKKKKKKKKKKEKKRKEKGKKEWEKKSNFEIVFKASSIRNQEVCP